MESSTSSNKEFEKRLGRIEALLAKLAEGSKSRGSQFHMATADGQSDPDSDNDDMGGDNSDNFLAESDSEKRDLNVHITHGKKK